ncbi:unnamed protein product [Phytophthora fragariaefolia]|uniref:Unnamed protein product n=1 Tax=Phytophthora fragariaefolia TaxID=1490495 RepID=A0A9W7D6G1_9STRA|nr:unnamed protein product [Phytophthora fragariaefolia]
MEGDTGRLREGTAPQGTRATEALLSSGSRRLDVSFKEYEFAYVRAKLLNKSMVNADYDITKDPTKNKLLQHCVGPFAIVKRVNDKLLLPVVVRSHDAFNVDQLKLSVGCPPEFMVVPFAAQLHSSLMKMETGLTSSRPYYKSGVVEDVFNTW